MRKVVKDDNSEIQFRYDASGNRIAKITATDTTVYARDASGNVMAVYKNDTLTEQSIYGSSRLGLVNYASKTGYRSLGGKKYELSNHLGNVLAVVSDNIHLDQDSTWTSLINTTDYYPFGLAMDGRSVQDSTYRYGFNTQEKVDEIKGPGKHYTAEFWEYDPKVVHRWNLDPRPNPSISSYAILQGNPIWYSDHLGDTIRIAGSDGDFMNYSPGLVYKGENKFFSQSVNALNTLYEGGETGRELINNLHSMGKISTIHDGNSNKATGYEVFWNPLSNSGGLDQLGGTTRDPFIGLGHELAHVWDFNKKITQSTFGVWMYDEWFTIGSERVLEAEKYGTHIENQIRAEHNLPLRTHYGIRQNENGSISGLGALIKGNESLYFKNKTIISVSRDWLLFKDSSIELAPLSTELFSSPIKYK